MLPEPVSLVFEESGEEYDPARRNSNMVKEMVPECPA